MRKRCAPGLVAVTFLAPRRKNHRLVTVACIIWILQVWWRSPFSPPGHFSRRPVTFLAARSPFSPPEQSAGGSPMRKDRAIQDPEARLSISPIAPQKLPVSPFDSPFDSFRNANPAEHAVDFAGRSADRLIAFGSYVESDQESAAESPSLRQPGSRVTRDGRMGGQFLAGWWPSC